MFTGLVEDVGVVRSLAPCGSTARLSVQTALPVQEIAVGDSVAVNGVCLTVEECAGKTLHCFCLAETLSRTNLGRLSPGERVNLERAMKAGGRFGGHVVQGHVDFPGTVLFAGRRGEDWELEVEIPAGQEPFFVEKGSVAVNGVSLTVARLMPHSFAICMIPHTGMHTNLEECRPGTLVNVETDVLGKYAVRILGLGRGTESAHDASLRKALAENGFGDIGVEEV